MSELLNSAKNKFHEYFVNDSKDYVCVIGGSNIDIVGSSPIIKNKESNIGQVSISPGGVARNVAENLGRFKVPTKFVSVIGNDYFGNIVMESLKNLSIDLAGVRKIANRRTGSYLAMLDDFRDMDFAINDMTITDFIDEEWIDKCSEFISNAKIVVLDCNLKIKSIEKIIKLAKGRIYVDPVSMTKAVSIVPYLKYIWAVKPNAIEAEVMTSIKVDSPKNGALAIKALLEAGVEKPVVTMGADGVVAYVEGKIRHFKNQEISPINVTGAGDAFFSTWVASDFYNLEFSEAIHNGMASAVKTMSSMETVSKDLYMGNFEKWKNEVEIYEEILEN